MRLEFSTWTEVETYLARRRDIIVPIGSTEQHGPTGLLGADFICAQALADRVADLEGALAAPVIKVGMSIHHLDFPGSMTLRPSTLLLVVRDYILSLFRHGFNRFFFINGHGGNLPTIRAAFSEVHVELGLRPPEAELRCLAVNWWETKTCRELSAEIFGQRDGAHATASEISVTQAVFPDLIKSGDLSPDPAPYTGIYGTADFRRRYPDGRIGSDPSLSSPEKGKRLLEGVAGELAGQYREFVEEA